MNFKKGFDHPKKWAYWILSIVVVISLYFILLDRFAPSTSDATTQAYILKVSSYVSGKIKSVSVHNNQTVKKGQVLFSIIPAPYEYVYEKAKGNVVIAEHQVKQLALEVKQHEAMVLSSRAKLKYAKILYQQMERLFDEKAISRDKLLQAQDSYNIALQNVNASKDALAKAKQNLGPFINGENIHVKNARSALKMARFNLKSTRVRASVQGYVTNLHIRKGSYVLKGADILTVIDNQDWWVQANFKENNLSRIKPGQKVQITFASNPGKIFLGKVESIGWGVKIDNTGQNSNLPDIQKTNNWVNLAQRFPVKININHIQHKFPLRIGTTAIVTVYTTDNFVISIFAHFNQWIRSLAQYLY